MRDPKDLVGHTLNNTFEVKSLIESGGMGVVYDAFDKRLNRRVAIKVILPRHAWNQEAVNAFAQEARIIAGLRHPHILQVLALPEDTFNNAPLAYLVMDYAEGGSLAAYLKNSGPLSEQDALRLIKQVASALDYAHNKGVLHLDLKPKNILLDENGDALVADFGLARLLESATHIKADTGAGTSDYMAPEQRMGTEARRTADVYAIGITLYEMLTKKVPRAKIRANGAIQRTFDKPLAPHIMQVIRKATFNFPQSRYQTVGELAQAFEAAINPAQAASQAPPQTTAQAPAQVQASAGVIAAPVQGNGPAQSVQSQTQSQRAGRARPARTGAGAVGAVGGVQSGAGVVPVSLLQTYLAEIRRIAETSATEVTYRPTLETLVRGVASSLNRPLHTMTMEPGHITEAGAPDFVLFGPTRGELIGYIETKSLRMALDPDRLPARDALQFSRYLAAFPTWIFTNFLEFRLYESGQLAQNVELCTIAQLTGNANLAEIAAQKTEELSLFLDRFLQHSVPAVVDASQLAALLAHKARLLENVLLTLLGGNNPNAALQGQLNSYREWLIPDLSEEKFADFYAQTITYGLFYAAFERSLTHPNTPLDRAQVLNLLPAAIHPVRAIFQLLAAQLLPSELNWIIDDLLVLLNKADMRAISTQLGRSRDPVVHFYETFLSMYDPKLREKLGVYYTPDEVVSYIVGSVDGLLKTHFSKSDGLASPDVTLLDPALGTGTFMVEAFRAVARNFGQANAGAVPGHFANHTLNNFYGFEYLAAPYVLAHLKLGQTLEQLGIRNAQPRVYLTNTLSDHEFPATLPGIFEQGISADGRAAQQVKGQQRILVIVGNPPYRGASSNVYTKVDDYRVPGERARNWLQNDYVKFIRWAEWKIAETEEAGYRSGIVGFITDNSYLRGPLFRGMRRHLIDNFSHIYILNLHGRTRPPERPPQGVAVDRNVFDIMQGVAIVLLVKEEGQSGPAEVYYSDLWGTRQVKYAYLGQQTAQTTHSSQTRIYPDEPQYYFTALSYSSLVQQYRSWPSVTQILPTYSQAIVSARDKFLYDTSEQRLWERMQDFASNTITDEIARARYELWDTSNGWTVSDARRKLSAQGTSAKKLALCSYRPFDDRWLYYSNAVVWRTRENVLGNMLNGRNLALVTFRHTRQETPDRVFATRHLVDARLLSSESNCYAFPLYRYLPDVTAAGQATLNLAGDTGRETTIPEEVLTRLNNAYGVSVTPEDVFHYMYGVLSAPEYLAEFEQSLAEDFPRIPFTSDYALFTQMANAGKRLVDLHLLEAADLQGLTNLTVGFPVAGNNTVERGYPTFDPNANRVLISGTQYFSDVTQEMWEYRVGGYMPLQKWLEDRSLQILSGPKNDPRHYQTTATAINKVLGELPGLDTVWQAILSSDQFVALF